MYLLKLQRQKERKKTKEKIMKPSWEDLRKWEQVLVIRCHINETILYNHDDGCNGNKGVCIDNDDGSIEWAVEMNSEYFGKSGTEQFEDWFSHTSNHRWKLSAFAKKELVRQQELKDMNYNQIVLTELEKVRNEIKEQAERLLILTGKVQKSGL